METIINVSDPQLHMIDFKQYGFKIGYPNAWIKADGGKALFACKMNCNVSKVFCPNIVLNIVLKKEGALLSNYTEFFVKKIQTEFNDMQLVSSIRGNIHGFACTTIDYKMTSNGTHLGATTCIVELDNFILFVNCMGDNEPEGKYVEYRSLFETVIKSVSRI